jgi:hypothetical protein
MRTRCSTFSNEPKLQLIKAKCTQIKAFNGLPPICFCLQDSLKIPLFAVSYKQKFLLINVSQNLALPRQQLKDVHATQMELIHIREPLLGQMAECVI